MKSFDVTCSQSTLATVVYRVTARSAEHARALVEDNPAELKVVHFNVINEEVDPTSVCETPPSSVLSAPSRR